MFCSEKLQWSRLYRDHKCSFLTLKLKIKKNTNWGLKFHTWNYLCIWLDGYAWICISTSRNLCTFSQIFGIFEITTQFEISSFHSLGYFLFCNFNIPQLLNLRTGQVIFTQLHRNSEMLTSHARFGGNENMMWAADIRTQSTEPPRRVFFIFYLATSVMSYVLLEASSGEQNWNLKVTVTEHHIFSKYNYS